MGARPDLLLIPREPFMSSITTPLEKKRLAYLKDHYVRGPASPKNWRKVKPFKKAKASRAVASSAKSSSRSVQTTKPPRPHPSVDWKERGKKRSTRWGLSP